MNIVIEQIPEGHENAITVEELAFRTGFSNRYIRDSIANSEELIINLQDGEGYFKPLPTEGDLVRVWTMLMRSRIKEIEDRLIKAKDWNGK